MTRALKDDGLLSVEEPFAGLFTQGMVTHETYKVMADGRWVTPAEIEPREGRLVESATGLPIEIGGVEKMSKSKKNVVAPEEIFESHGADAARLFVLSDSPPERDVQWTASGLEGSWRLVHRIWSEFDAHPADPLIESGPEDGERAAELHRLTHRTVKAVTEAIQQFRFNSAIARLYEFLNALKAWPIEATGPAVLGARTEALSALARLVAPFAPHLAEECWARLGQEGMVVEAAWPVYDPELAVENERVLPVQVNGKRRGEIRVAAGLAAPEVEKIALADAEVRKHLEGLNVRKVIVVQDRIVNIVVG